MAKTIKTRAKTGPKTTRTTERKVKSGSEGSRKSEFGEFPLKKENFIIIGAGFFLIILGYILMYGTENIFSFRQMGLPVIVILLGFAVQLYGVMAKNTFLSSSENSQEKSENTSS